MKVVKLICRSGEAENETSYFLLLSSFNYFICNLQKYILKKKRLGNVITDLLKCIVPYFCPSVMILKARI